MEKLNFKKKLKHLYSSKINTISIIDVPKMNFLMIDGEGDPNSAQSFKDAVQSLYGLSYTLKFMIKRGPQKVDYGVLPLEGLWWAEDMANFSMGDKDEWKWTLMIMQPEYVTPDLVEEAKKQLKEKKDPASLSKVTFKAFKEGKAAQTMHIGPFSQEGPVIQELHDFIKNSGGKMTGKHHEIYLSDMRKAAPENWKTIIRQPMR